MQDGPHAGLPTVDRTHDSIAVDDDEGRAECVQAAVVSSRAVDRHGLGESEALAQELHALHPIVGELRLIVALPNLLATLRQIEAVDRGEHGTEVEVQVGRLSEGPLQGEQHDERTIL